MVCFPLVVAAGLSACSRSHVEPVAQVQTIPPEDQALRRYLGIDTVRGVETIPKDDRVLAGEIFCFADGKEVRRRTFL